MEFKWIRSGQIEPRGWLRRQLEQQASGLNGQLDKVWKDIYDSRWLGGSSDGWERLPYFLDGYIPLAYILRDEEKIERAKRYVNELLSRQREDGCFVPNGEGEMEDIWPLYLILKVLTVYADCSGDERVEESVYRGLLFLNTSLNHRVPDNWAAARWFECLIPVLWLYERRREDWLIRLAKRLRMYGLDYERAMDMWEEPSGEWTYETHVVNIAMALKGEALYCELTGEKRSGLAERMTEKLFERHGTAYGHFTGDECLSGTSPVQGSELCGVVEAMYSYEWLTALTGEAKWGDLLESTAFNGLAAAVSGDMWTHQYDQQVNQIACVPFEHPIFRTNGGEANMFGLEPHFGCCTANFGQGWPKLALSAYMKKGDSLVVLSPLPAKLTLDGNQIVCTSEYPFRSAFTLRAEKEIKVLLRIPAWTRPRCEEPHHIEDKWMTLTLPAGKETRVEFPAEARLEERPEGRHCLKYGALLFALPIEGEKEMREYEANGVVRKYPYCDYAISPVGEWRYAFAGETFTVQEREYSLPFDRKNPPLTLTAKLVPVEWGYEEGHELVAARMAGTAQTGKPVLLEMYPYGATDLRITEMAVVKTER